MAVPVFVQDRGSASSLNANCAGTGGGYRVDTVDDQDFINPFLD
jgi:hypothetical protein